MELNPDGVGFDLATTARAIKTQGDASNVPDIGTPAEVIQAANYEADAAAGGGGGGGGSSSGGATQTPQPTVLPSMDWAAAFFGGLGLPSDVISKVNQIFSQYSDTTSASAAALAYIRGTPWYAQTYPGIQEGFAKGIVSNEADYRNLLNQQTQIYKQYLGRDISSDEFANNLREGAGLSTIGGRLQGAALVGTYGNDWQSKLGAFGDQNGGPTPDELKALGEENAGIDSPLGQQIKNRLDMAQQRFSKIFQGTLAAPSLSLATGRASAPGLASTFLSDSGA